MDSKPLSNNTQPLPSPSTTDWQLPRRGTTLSSFIFLSLSLSLYIFYLSLDVGFCDDIPLMAARFFFKSILFQILIFKSRDFMAKKWQRKRMLGGCMGEGREE